MFFFEKKNQKTFASLGAPWDWRFAPLVLVAAAPVPHENACPNVSAYYDGCLNHHVISIIAHGLGIARGFQFSDATLDLPLLRKSFSQHWDCFEYYEASGLPKAEESVLQQNRCDAKGKAIPSKVPLSIRYSLPVKEIASLHWTATYELLVQGISDDRRVVAALTLDTRITGPCPTQEELGSVMIAGAGDRLLVVDGNPYSQFGTRAWMLPTQHGRTLSFSMEDNNLSRSPICRISIQSMSEAISQTKI